MRCVHETACVACSTTTDFMPLGFARQWKRGALVSAIGKWRKGNQKNEDIVVALETLLKLFFDYWDDMSEG